MAEKTINSRIQLKTDTSSNWSKATNFIPKKGEFIFYSDLQKFKMGDGSKKVSELDFVNMVMKYFSPASPVDSMDVMHTHGTLTDSQYESYASAEILQIQKTYDTYDEYEYLYKNWSGFNNDMSREEDSSYLNESYQLNFYMELDSDIYQWELIPREGSGGGIVAKYTTIGGTAEFPVSISKFYFFEIYYIFSD